MKLGQNNLKIEVTHEDIMRGECANRSQCVIAQAVDRQFALRGTGYIRIDAGFVAVTSEGFRYTYHPTHGMARYLRKFDELGAMYGLDRAREMLTPRGFNCRLMSVHPTAPGSSSERKAQINARRNAKRAEEKALGLTPTTKMPRYTGV